MLTDAYNLPTPTPVSRHFAFATPSHRLFRVVYILKERQGETVLGHVDTEEMQVVVSENSSGGNHELYELDSARYKYPLMRVTIEQRVVFILKEY